MQLVQPSTIQEATRVLSENEWDANIVAGGTALVLMMQQKLIEPEMLVSLQGIQGLSGVSESNGSVFLGCNTTLREVAEHPQIRARYPSLANACGEVANVRIRNAATIGGNLAEADYASDPPSVLVALDASVTVTGPKGEREIPVAELITGFYTTSLEPAEIITGINLPARSPNSDDTYVKYLSRSSEDRPCIGVAVRADFSSDSLNRLSDLRIVVGAAAAVPQRFPEIENTAVGREIKDLLVRELADGYAETIEPIEDQRGSPWYRKQMVRTFVTRALDAIRDQTGSGR